MTIKQQFQRAITKTLDTAQKGIKWCQEHPVATERTVLIVGTFFIARKAYKNYYPGDKVALEFLKKNSGSIAAVNPAVTKLISKAGKPIDVVTSAAPKPLNDSTYSKLFHLQLGDVDIQDMDVHGMGLLYNVKNIPGYLKESFPVAVMPYNHVKPALEKAGWVNLPEVGSAPIQQSVAPLFDQYFGKLPE